MRKIIVLAFSSLDGVMQAPGGPNEDTSNGFAFGGWSVPYWDGFLEKVMGRQMGVPFELLLGRKTYDIFEGAWPTIDPNSEINKCTKYVVTHRELPPETEVWKNSARIEGDVVEGIRKLKEKNGPDIQVHGSTEVIQLLLENGLADELWLKIYPVVLGKGKRLFGKGTIPAGLKLVECSVSPSGVIVANYSFAGEVKTGSFEPEKLD